MSLLSIVMRAVGRLRVRGVITRELGAAMIRDAWASSAAELLPAGYTSSAEHRATLHAAAGNDFWCDSCEDIPHRVNAPGTKCPGCMDDERRGRRAS